MIVENVEKCIFPIRVLTYTLYKKTRRTFSYVRAEMNHTKTLNKLQ